MTDPTTQLRDLLAKGYRPLHLGADGRIYSGTNPAIEAWLLPDVRALIVAAVNALPALLDVADAAQALHDYLTLPLGEGGDLRPIRERLTATLIALAALKEAK